MFGAAPMKMLMLVILNMLMLVILSGVFLVVVQRNDVQVNIGRKMRPPSASRSLSAA